jgi:hypothetical protein
MVVYGSAYPDVMEAIAVPTLVGGDFNLVRNVKEKTNEIVNFNLSFLFND